MADSKYSEYSEYIPLIDMPSPVHEPSPADGYSKKSPLIDGPSSVGVWPKNSLPPASWYSMNHDTVFCFYLVFTTIALISPWIFFLIVWGLGGIIIHNSYAEKNPKETSYVVTGVSNIIAAVMTHLFSAAVSYLAQKRIVHKGATISHVSFFTAFKNRTPSLSLFRRRRYDLFLMVLLYSIIFLSITPGITTLLTPFHFTRTIPLYGRELNFASNNTECENWFQNFSVPETCDWDVYNNLHYTTCLSENQLSDPLESGRGKILLLLGNNVSITYRQFASGGGLNFLGSTRGMLPNGPNGISAFDTLDEPLVPTFSDTATALRPSYNYTLDLQGMSSNVSCKYDTTSPINVIDIREGLIQYSGTCPPGQDFLPSPVFVSQSSPHSLGFWACRTAPSADSYYLYFRGYNTSAHTIGMITCIVSPIQPTVFPLTYTGQTDTFHAQPPISSSPVSSTKLGDQMIGSIGSIVWETQSSVSNAFAEAITTLGVKSFSLPSNIQAEGYMQLYEAMIQGILDYEATYIRLLYSVRAGREQTPSDSCFRPVIGFVDNGIFGWNSTSQTVVFLLPITLVNLTTLAILVIAMSTADKGKLLPNFDPTDPESLLLSHDPSGKLLLSAMAKPTDDAPWSSMMAFGKNSYGIYRLWPEHEVMST